MTAPVLELLPAVDVQGGQAVRLVQGEAGTETGYGAPLDAALAFQEGGASWLHLVDLDAAFGRGSHASLLAEVVPHMGWNTVEPAAGSALFAGIEQERFYFVHSYAARSWELEDTGPLKAPQVTWAQHEQDRFVAAVENGALSATQFHPEKSGAAGARLLANWLGTLPRRDREQDA